MVFPGTGIQENLADKAAKARRKLGKTVAEFASEFFATIFASADCPPPAARMRAGAFSILGDT